jgi:hypothetical protein
MISSRLFSFFIMTFTFYYYVLHNFMDSLSVSILLSSCSQEVGSTDTGGLTVCSSATGFAGEVRHFQLLWLSH